MNRRKTAAEMGQSSPTAAKLGVLCEAVRGQRLFTVK